MRESHENMETVASFLSVCQETGIIALVFYCTVARERVKIHILISHVSTGSYRLGRPGLDNQKCPTY
jgi:hypothetical protein